MGVVLCPSKGPCVGDELWPNTGAPVGVTEKKV